MAEEKTEIFNEQLEGSKELEGHLEWLDTFTPAALGVLSTASGIYTYLGVTTLLDDTGALSVIAAVAYATAVSVGIFVFWSYLLRLLPAMRNPQGYFGLAFATLVGSAAIVAMSSWLNATALAGSAAVEQHLGKTITEYQIALEDSYDIAITAQSLEAEVARSAQNFRDLASQERKGDLSGKAGTGAIYSVLLQKADELERLRETISSKSETIDSEFKSGNKIITKMQTLKAGVGPVDVRSLKFSEESINLSGIITNLRQISAAPLVFRAAGDLEKIILPELDGKTADFRETQKTLIASVENSIMSRAKTLRDAAQEIMNKEQPKKSSYNSISSAEAVIIYADKFVPQWAGAIAIDLLPAILVFMLAITQSAIRRGRSGSKYEDKMTLAELKIAMKAMKDVEKNKEK